MIRGVDAVRIGLSLEISHGVVAIFCATTDVRVIHAVQTIECVILVTDGGAAGGG